MCLSCRPLTVALHTNTFAALLNQTITIIISKSMSKLFNSKFEYVDAVKR